jgi:hypothetical protein
LSGMQHHSSTIGKTVLSLLVSRVSAHPLLSLPIKFEKIIVAIPCYDVLIIKSLRT